LTDFPKYLENIKFIQLKPTYSLFPCARVGPILTSFRASAKSRLFSWSLLQQYRPLFLHNL